MQIKPQTSLFRSFQIFCKKDLPVVPAFEHTTHTLVIIAAYGRQELEYKITTNQCEASR